MVSVTSARPSAGRPAVPAKTTSSILPPRSGLTPCWPITQANASTTLDLPDPFGPTTHVMPGSKRSVVAEANDLNPRSVRLFRYTACSPHPLALNPIAPYRLRLRASRHQPGTPPRGDHSIFRFVPLTQAPGGASDMAPHQVTRGAQIILAPSLGGQIG